MAEDALVGWAWAPGVGRAPAPGSQAEFGALVRAWAGAGRAPVPGTQAEFGALVRAWAAAGGDCPPP